MKKLYATMTRRQLEDAVAKAKRYPHRHLHRGDIIMDPAVFDNPDRETNLVISPFALLDCTGSIHIGPWCNIGPRTRIYTHDTIHLGKEPLSLIEEQMGVAWQDKYIGADVWIHDGATVLYQVTHIADGVVVGAGSILTKNPKAYEIWAGCPAHKIGERTDMDRQAMQKAVNARQYRLKDEL